MAAPPKVQTSEFEVPRLPAFPSSGFPTAYLTSSPADPAVDEGLQFSEDYGLARPTEGLDFSTFERAGSSPAMTYVEEHNDEFIPWLHY